MITNCKLIHHGKKFQSWTFELDGTEYGYITNTSAFGGGWGRGAVSYKPYTRIFKTDDPNKLGYKPVANIVEFNEFMPLDFDNPIPGIEKCYKLMLLI